LLLLLQVPFRLSASVLVLVQAQVAQARRARTLILAQHGATLLVSHCSAMTRRCESLAAAVEVSSLPLVSGAAAVRWTTARAPDSLHHTSHVGRHTTPVTA
jgi:uncharacterized membrane protein